MIMACKSCGSEKQSEFVAEMNIRHSGRKGLDKPVVWVFPKVLVCFDCGTTLFNTPEAQLLELQKGAAA